MRRLIFSILHLKLSLQISSKTILRVSFSYINHPLVLEVLIILAKIMLFKVQNEDYAFASRRLNILIRNESFANNSIHTCLDLKLNKYSLVLFFSFTFVENRQRGLRQNRILNLNFYHTPSNARIVKSV